MENANLNPEPPKHVPFEQYEKLKKEKEDLREEIDELRIKLNYMCDQFRLMQKKVFGKSKETFQHEEQQDLIEALFGSDPTPKTTHQEPEKDLSKKERKKPKREKLDESIPREEVVLEPKDVPADARIVSETITERLKYTPAKYTVLRYIRRKYAVDDEFGNTKFFVADLPLTPIEKSNADASVIAHILSSKYCDHIPIYRQRQMMKRVGIEIPESTILGWIKSSAQVLMPLYDHVKELVLKSRYLQADETTIPVLTKDKPGSTHKGYFWQYYAPKIGALCFEYQRGRSETFPLNTLKDFIGVLQTDGYAAYNLIGKKEGVIHLACMAHLRRYFFDALKNDPDKAEFVLQRIQLLYLIERKATEEKLSDQERYVLRQEKAVPILNEIEKWLFDPALKFLPKSKIGEAITYAQNRWSKIIRYVEDGSYLIDNNPIENKFRPLVIGRKNYLFAGSHSGAENAAVFYTLIGMCKIADVDPYAWLSDILNRVSVTKPSDFDSLLPQNWKLSQK